MNVVVFPREYRSICLDTFDVSLFFFDVFLTLCTRGRWVPPSVSSYHLTAVLSDSKAYLSPHFLLRKSSRKSCGFHNFPNLSSPVRFVLLAGRCSDSLSQDI